VSQEQLQSIQDQLMLLSPDAKVLTATQSKIDVKEILNTRLFSTSELSSSTQTAVLMGTKKNLIRDEPKMKSCCEKSLVEGGSKCCKSKNKNVVDTGLSQALLGVGQNGQKSRHEARFGITSFVYKARRPFHSGRLYELFLEPYFMMQGDESIPVSKLQKASSVKQGRRAKELGDLLRSKGFFWLATSHGVMGGWSQAGNVLTVAAEGRWMCDMRELWEGSPAEYLVTKDMRTCCGKEYKYGDRRQELVFIGLKLSHEAIQSKLDQCLLRDEEMAESPEAWLERMANDDALRLNYDDEEEEEEEPKKPVKKAPVKKKIEKKSTKSKSELKKPATKKAVKKATKKK